MDAQTSSKANSFQNLHSQCETNLNTALTAVVQLHGLAAHLVNHLFTSSPNFTAH